jgi:dTDP-4-dehydrorhamnose 3,5-epimerase
MSSSPTNDQSPITVVQAISIINGSSHQDLRGKISFINDCDLSKAKRFYVIEPAGIEVVRAWQAHQREEKWFYVIEGSFKIVLTKPDDWKNPSSHLPFEEYILTASQAQILYVPGGYANGFQSLEPKSKIMVFSSFTVKESMEDDFRYDKSLWYKW